MPLPSKRLRANPSKFSLLGLLEFVTLCGLLAACAPLLGTVTSGCLMGLALALWARQGEMALAMLMTVSWAANHEATVASEVWTQVAALSLAAALCAWYAYRRHRAQRCETPEGP